MKYSLEKARQLLAEAVRPSRTPFTRPGSGTLPRCRFLPAPAQRVESERSAHRLCSVPRRAVKDRSAPTAHLAIPR